MLNKLAWRNAKKLWKDYLTYFLTLCMIAALMLAFHSLLFSGDIYEMIHYGESGEISTAGSMLITFMAVSTILIIMVSAWLVNYMAHFMLEKRSKEFAIYLLAGIKRNQISKLYLKETLFLGLGALSLGMLLGMGLQQILFFLFYKSIGKHYKVHFGISAGSVILTVFLYGLCLGTALFRNKKAFSGMEIIRLLHMDQENEVMRRKKNNRFRWILRGDSLFLMRQFSSKIRNTCFTLVALCLLFTASLLGSSLAFMLSDYQNRQLEVEYPFDIIILSDDTEKTFAEEANIIRRSVEVRDKWIYSVYENGTDDVRDFLYQHLQTFSDEDIAMTEIKRDIAYYEYDVYIGLTDYNYLRMMLGYDAVSLQDNQYLVHMPNRVYRELFHNRMLESLHNSIKTELKFARYRTEGFAQSGHNGADFLIVVPDDAVQQMNKYFSLMAVMAKGDVPEELSEFLYRQAGKKRGYDEINDYIKIGSEEIFLMPASIQVKSREVTELKFLMSTLSFPLFYIGLIFLCVSLTVLSVQQLSDSSKYKFRYDILYKLGMRKKRRRFLIAKQLFFYYLCPAFTAAAISMVLVYCIAEQFLMHTGIEAVGIWYFALSLAGFLGIYILYFGMTYVQFVRNVER